MDAPARLASCSGAKEPLGSIELCLRESEERPEGPGIGLVTSEDCEVVSADVT